jgi:hypothetical protein
MASLTPCEPGRVTTLNSHSFKQDTLPTASLISKQVISYRPHGGTCCPEVSTPMTRSLADSSMINHKSWRSQPSSLFQTLLKLQHQISPRSPHIMTDGRPTLSTLHASQTQHHKDGKNCTTVMTVELSNTTKHKNPILKHEGLDNQLIHASSVY